MTATAYISTFISAQYPIKGRKLQRVSMTAEQQPVKGVGGLCQEFLSAWISAFACTAEGHVRVCVCEK